LRRKPEISNEKVKPFNGRIWHSGMQESEGRRNGQQTVAEKLERHSPPDVLYFIIER